MTSISATLPDAGAGGEMPAPAYRCSAATGDGSWSGAVLALILGTVAFLFPVSALFAFTMVFAAYAGADGLLSTMAGVRGATRPRAYNSS
jgi:uncharacterized membrane protein HdeD (DUF308 family)